MRPSANSLWTQRIASPSCAHALPVLSVVWEGDELAGGNVVAPWRDPRAAAVATLACSVLANLPENR